MRRLLLGLVCFFASQMTYAQSNSPSGTALSAQGGRFVYGQISGFRKDQFMLDTQTGRLWTMVCTAYSSTDPNQCSSTSLQPVEYLNSKGEPQGFMPGGTK